MIVAFGPSAGLSPVQVPAVELMRTAATGLPLIVAGMETANACVAAVSKLTESVLGVLMANGMPAAAVTVMLCVVDTDTAPLESSHSAATTTVPAEVGVRVTLLVEPVTPVVSVAEESVAAPVLAAAIVKRMVWPFLPVPAASLAAAARVIVPAPTCTEPALGVSVSVDPVMRTGMLVVFPPAVTVTVAVRLLESIEPLDRVTLATPVAPDFWVDALSTPLVVAKVTVTSAIAALEASNGVAVRVAVVELSVLIEIADVPKDKLLTAAVVVPVPVPVPLPVPVVVAVGAVLPPPPQPASRAIDAAIRSDVENPAILLFMK